MNLSGFVTPEQDFGGLYKVTDTIRRKQYQDAAAKAQESSKKNASAKFLTDYLDPKAHLTGTAYDPQIIKGFNDLLQEGMELVNQGADNNTLLMALGQKAGKLSQYSQTAKVVSDRIAKQLQAVPSSGYDKSKLEAEARRTAFYNEDGSLKDLAEVDPEKDWLTEAVKLYPERVTTDASIDEFVNKSQKIVNTEDVTTYTPTGGMSRSKKKITSYPWQVPDIGERGELQGMVPKYDVALEGGQPLIHEFVDEKGSKTKAPVRLLAMDQFKSILANNSGIADWVRGQVKEHISEYGDGNIKLDSPQATNVARAILYDELKRRGGFGMEDIEIQNKPSAQEIRINYGYSPYSSRGGGSGGSGESSINDMMGRISNKVQQAAPGKGFPINQLDSDEQTAVIDIAKKLSGEPELSNGDFYLKVDGNKIGIYLTDKEQKAMGRSTPFLGNLSEIGVNVKVQPSVKEKREVIKGAGSKTTKSNNDPLGILD
jgi:hypothetical protein